MPVSECFYLLRKHIFSTYIFIYVAQKTQRIYIFLNCIVYLYFYHCNHYICIYIFYVSGVIGPVVSGEHVPGDVTDTF